MYPRPPLRTLVAPAVALLVGGCLEQGPVSPPLGAPEATSRDQSPLHAPGELVAFATNLDQGEIYVLQGRDPSLVRTRAVSPRPQHVVFSPDGTRAFVTHNVSVPQSDDAAGLTVLRTADAAIVATLPAVPGRPFNTASVLPDGSHLYLTNGRYRADEPGSFAKVVRTRDLEVVDRVDAGPHLMGAASPDGSRVYMTGCLPCSETDDGFVTVIATADNALAATIPVAPEPNRIALSPDGSRVYASHPRRGEVTVISASDNTVVEVLDAPFALPLAVSPDGARLYVVNRPFGEVGSVTVFRTDSHEVETVFDVGVTPQDLAFTPDGELLFVANSGSGTISVHRTTDHVRVADVFVGEGVVFIDLIQLPSAAERIEELRDAVDALEEEGILSHGQATALRAHLENVRRSLERGLLHPAGAQLSAFVSKVEELRVDGALGEQEAEELLAAADALRVRMEGWSDG